MTRDEAIKLLSGIWQPIRGRGDLMEPLVQNPDGWVKAFVALGMLKLDEPPTPDRIAEDIIGLAIREQWSPVRTLALLSERGFKIVEK